MNIETRLLSKVLLEKDIRSCLDRRVRAEFFQDEGHAALYEWMIEYYNRYGSTPTADAMRRNHPWFKVVKAPEDLAWYIDQLMDARLYAVMYDSMAEAEAAMKAKDAAKAMTIMQAAFSSLTAEISPLRDINLSDPEYIATWLAEYEELKSLDGALRGLPTGFPTIDRATSGYQPEQLITIIGLAKAGKSTGLLLTAKAVHDSGRSPLFVGFEMSNDEQKSRYAAIRARINYHRLYTGRLSQADEKLFKKALHELENTPDLWLTADPSATSTVSGIQAKLDTYDPAILLIDGVYLMVDEISGEQNTPTALTNITRNLKRMAQHHRIPIVCTTQALAWKTSKRRGLTVDSIGYTSSFAQDSDVILGLESYEDDEDKKKLKIVAARNLRNYTVDINWDWDTGTFEEMDAPNYDDEEKESS
jgi:replicative DNA helicase